MFAFLEKDDISLFRNSIFIKSKLMKRIALNLILFLITTMAVSENGSRLWLRFPEAQVPAGLITHLVGDTSSLPLREFRTAWHSMTGVSLLSNRNITSKSLWLLTPADSRIHKTGMLKQLKSLGPEGFILRSLVCGGDTVTVVAANADAGLLYGVYHLIRLLQLHAFTYNLDVVEKPDYAIRILNHWDNPDGTVERGYAGHSIWKWDELPSKLSPRYIEYARANASIGINATVLNNVNASPQMLSSGYLLKVKALANVLRPYHIKVCLAINFSSPKVIGGLPTSDPLDVRVRHWWALKANEIYSLIPDFGGFLVKANSEGLPGPMDYGRTHVDGANMLADALKPYGGVVMWRAFVYEPGDDRVKLAYNEFHKFDGQFRDNVLIQVKNGPVDFQPREPFSPLFGAMKRTALMPEVQITQEYLGQGNHLVFLGSMWREFMDADTYSEGAGATIAKLTTGKLNPQKITAFAGVANIGDDANWCGQDFAQANWYAFGRLAWKNTLSTEQIAGEWVQLTFQQPASKAVYMENCDQFMDGNSFLSSLKSILLTSHETAVDYMMPLGLHHIFAWNHHYGPEPWCEIVGARPDWLPNYYHRADSTGLGADRTSTGSNAVSQYFSPLKEQLEDIHQCPEKYLLWFHHVSWNYRMKSGNTLWNELCRHYDHGVMQVREYQKIWDRGEAFVDAARFKAIQSKLRIQAHDAVWWKDACLLYFQTFSHQSIPCGIERPVYELDSLRNIKLNMKHHN